MYCLRFPRAVVFCFFFFQSAVVWGGGLRRDRNDQNLLIIASPHPLVLIIPIVENFENDTGIDVRIIQGGTGEILQNILRYPDTAPCDLLWGGSYSSVLPFASFFSVYYSKNESSIQPAYKNREGTMTRFSDIPSVIMINKKRLGSIVVQGYADLLNPRLRGAIAFGDPEKSSSAWEHLVNMLYAEGHGNPENGWLYVEKLCANLDGILVYSSKDVYNGVAEGKFAVGLTFEEGGANFAEYDRNIALVYMKEGVVFTPDGLYILKNAVHGENSRKFIDYATGFSVQNYISLQLNRRPVRADSSARELLPSKDGLRCLTVDYSYAASRKQVWVRRFHEIFEASGKNTHAS